MLDQLWNYMVGYDSRYIWKTLNDPKGNPFTDVYQGGLFIETYLEEDDGWEARTDKDINDDEARSRIWYDKWFYDADAEIKALQQNVH